MKTLAKYHVCNHGVIGEKTFKNILIGPDKLLGLSRKGPQETFDEEPLCGDASIVIIIIIIIKQPLHML